MFERATVIDEKKQYFKGLLNKTLNALLTETKRTSRGITYSNSKQADFIDQASLETDSCFNWRIRERKGRLIQKVKDAIQRLENGTFGICEECDP